MVTTAGRATGILGLAWERRAYCRSNKPKPPSQRPSLGYRADGTDPTSGHSHFRSANEIIGYHVRANDDHIGHVEELLMDIDD